MPLTPKGEEIKKALQEEYGKEKGEQVLYAGKNKGTFTGIDDDDDHGTALDQARAKVRACLGDARDDADDDDATQDQPQLTPSVPSAAGAGPSVVPSAAVPASAAPSAVPSVPPAMSAGDAEPEYTPAGMTTGEIAAANKERWGGEITHGTTTPAAARQERTEGRGAPPVIADGSYRQVGPSIRDMQAAIRRQWG